MKSHIIMPGELFEDGVDRELHIKNRPHPENEGMVVERHMVPLGEKHQTDGFWCSCDPDLIEVGEPGQKKYAILHASEITRLKVPGFLPVELE